MNNRTRHIIVALLLLAIAAAAHAGEFFDQKPLAEGFVSSVDPFWHLVKINGGQLVIDASDAEIRGPAPNDISSFDAIRPGAHIAVVFQRGKYLNHQPLPATIIQVLRQPVGTITGEIESVDVAGGTFKILGQTIRATDATQYGGSVASLDPKTLAELPVGRSVTVFLDGDINSLTAQRVYVIAPLPDSQVVVSGILKKIDGGTWYLLHSTIDSFKVIRTTTI
ncbi:MAG TPA: DUF5666 domain-containing protein, partial [Thermoanaerobaculia bacterium]|nr:DUF5666 domain-containing protein [Thermoanaerobaculia bacterium]